MHGVLDHAYYRLVRNVRALVHSLYKQRKWVNCTILIKGRNTASSILLWMPVLGPRKRVN